MKTLKYFAVFCLMAGLSMVARNQDNRALTATQEGVTVVTAVYVDQQGVKWFGTEKGLVRFDDLTWTYYTEEDFLAGNNVNALAFEATGEQLWVGTSEGVTAVSFDNQGVTASTSYTAEEGLLSDNTSSIAVDSRGGKFFGSERGISYLDGANFDTLVFEEYFQYMFNTPVRKLNIYGDTLYIAQDGGIGRIVSGVDGISGASRWAGEYGISPFSTNIRSILVLSEQEQYYGTDAGVQTHNQYFAKDGWDLISTDQGLVNNDVIAINEDAQGSLWFGTYGGVSQWDGENWTTYTVADGLLSDTVYDIAFDTDGSVWFATARGASRLKDGEFADFITAIADQKAPEMNFDAWYSAPGQSLMLRYNLLQSGPVSARLFDIRGVLLEQWEALPGYVGRNETSLSLHHTRVGSSPGIYVLQISQGSHSAVHKLFLSP